MGTWNFVSITVTGDKKDVAAFCADALKHPILRSYKTTRRGKPVDCVLYEDMVFKKPARWCKFWWQSRFSFMTKDSAPVEMVHEASKAFPHSFFKLDWDWEHEEFGAKLFYRGKVVKSHEFNAEKRRDKLYRKLIGSKNDDDLTLKMDQQSEDDECDLLMRIDGIVIEEFDRRVESLMQSRMYQTLYARRRRKLMRQIF